MLHQTWLASGGARLLAVHRGLGGEYVGAAVLLAGFSHPMCDADYFMTRLARALARRGIFVAQVDPRGHGDSDGDLAEVDLETLREDVRAIVRTYAKRFPEQLLLVGRGLAGASLLEVAAEGPVLGVAAVSPYRLPGELLEQSLDCIGVADSLDASEVFQGKDYVEFRDFPPATLRILEALGTVAYNIHGMRISRRLLLQLSRYEAPEAPPASRRCLRLQDRFTRDPARQQELIARLESWAFDLSLMH